MQVSGSLGELFGKIREGQAPAKFTRQYLQDLGLKSSNWHASIKLLKGLGFLTSDGTPTSTYMDLLDETKWKTTLSHAVREAYSDIFVLKNNPSRKDKKLILGKYRSSYNHSDNVADRCASTFLALWELSDKSSATANSQKTKLQDKDDEPDTSANDSQTDSDNDSRVSFERLGLSYVIQVQLPASKDIEVFNAIFKSLRQHILD